MSQSEQEKVNQIEAKLRSVEQYMTERLPSRHSHLSAYICMCLWRLRTKRLFSSVEEFATKKEHMLHKLRVEVGSYVYQTKGQDEILTQKLCELDTIETMGNLELKERRKALVRKAQELLIIANGWKRKSSKLTDFVEKARDSLEREVMDNDTEVAPMEDEDEEEVGIEDNQREHFHEGISHQESTKEKDVDQYCDSQSAKLSTNPTNTESPIDNNHSSPTEDSNDDNGSFVPEQRKKNGSITDSNQSPDVEEYSPTKQNEMDQSEDSETITHPFPKVQSLLCGDTPSSLNDSVINAERSRSKSSLNIFEPQIPQPVTLSNQTTEEIADDTESYSEYSATCLPVWKPFYKIIPSDTNFTVAIHLRGVQEHNYRIHYDEKTRILQVIGIKLPTEKEYALTRFSGIPTFGRFDINVKVPQAYDLHSAKQKLYANGVLEIYVPSITSPLYREDLLPVLPALPYRRCLVW